MSTVKVTNKGKGVIVIGGKPVGHLQTITVSPPRNLQHVYTMGSAQPVIVQGAPTGPSTVTQIHVLDDLVLEEELKNFDLEHDPHCDFFPYLTTPPTLQTDCFKCPLQIVCMTKVIPPSAVRFFTMRICARCGVVHFQYGGVRYMCDVMRKDETIHSPLKESAWTRAYAVAQHVGNYDHRRPSPETLLGQELYIRKGAIGCWAFNRNPYETTLANGTTQFLGKTDCLTIPLVRIVGEELNINTSRVPILHDTSNGYGFWSRWGTNITTNPHNVRSKDKRGEKQPFGAYSIEERAHHKRLYMHDKKMCTWDRYVASALMLDLRVKTHQENDGDASPNVEKKSPA